MEQTNNQEEQNLKEFNPCLELISLLYQYPILMTNFFMDIIRILYKYPPAKNENKFIYGKVGEKRLIHWIHKIIECIELDKYISVGSEYKNDCEIIFSEDNTIKFSIKVSKSGGEPTLINKRNRSEHTVKDCYMLIVHIEKQRIYCFKHNESLDEFIKETRESIKYRPSVFKHLDKDKKNYYQFPKSEKVENLIKELESKSIEEDIYERLSKEIEKENENLYEQ